MIKKNILTIIVFIMTLFVIYEISDTYALFEKRANGVASENLASWVIKVNDTTMGNNTNTFPINSINWDNSSNLVSGKVAPGIGGYFDILIDPSDTDVSVRYDITYDYSELVNEMFQVTNIYEMTDNNLVRTGETTYTGIFTLEDIESNKTHLIRTEVEWINSEDNNVSDSELGRVYNNTIDIPVTVDITQYLNETVSSY